MEDQALQIRGGGGGGGVPSHPDPEIRGGVVSKNFFSQFASVWSKNKGGGGDHRAPPLDPPLQQYKKQRHTGF